MEDILQNLIMQFKTPFKILNKNTNEMAWVRKGLNHKNNYKKIHKENLSNSQFNLNS